MWVERVLGLVPQKHMLRPGIMYKAFPKEGLLGRWVDKEMREAGQSEKGKPSTEGMTGMCPTTG